MSRVTKRTAAGLVAVNLLAAGCSELPRAYVGLRGGVSASQDADHEPGVASDTFPGPAVAVAAGARWQGHLRTELEMSYRAHVFGDFDIMGTQVGGSGEVYGYGLLVNGIYEFDIARRWRPYVGLGVGMMRSGYDVDSFGGSFLDDDDCGFAGQLLLGVAAQVSDRLELSLGYRLMHAEDPVLTDTLGRRFDSEYTSQSIELGVSYSF